MDLDHPCGDYSLASCLFRSHRDAAVAQVHPLQRHKSRRSIRSRLRGALLVLFFHEQPQCLVREKTFLYFGSLVVFVSLVIRYEGTSLLFGCESLKVFVDDDSRV